MQTQANVLAYIDGFMVIGFAVIGVLLLMLFLRDPPTSRTAFAFQNKLKNGREIEQRIPRAVVQIDSMELWPRHDNSSR